MTIAAGILCTDGVVLGADDQHTGAIKQPGHKVWGIATRDSALKIGVAGAGDSVLLRAARDRIAGGIGESESQIDMAVAKIEDELVRLYTQHVYPHPGFRESTFGLNLVVSLRDEAGWSLYESSSTTLAKVDSHVCVGSGADLGSYLLETLIGEQKRSLTIGLALPLLVYVLKQAKKYSIYCGGESHLLMIGRNGSMAYATAQEVAEIEHVFKGSGADPSTAIVLASAQYEMRRHAEFVRRQKEAGEGPKQATRSDKPLLEGRPLKTLAEASKELTTKKKNVRKKR